MQYYERKALAQALIKNLKSKKLELEAIKFAVEDTYQLGGKWTEKYYNMLK